MIRKTQLQMPLDYLERLFARFVPHLRGGDYNMRQLFIPAQTLFEQQRVRAAQGIVL
jgi:hypothetical protein